MSLRDQRAKVTLAKNVVWQAASDFMRDPIPQKQRALEIASETLVFENLILSNMATEQDEHVPTLQEVS
jgi:hypothetical protein